MNPIPMATAPRPMEVEPRSGPERRRETLRLRRDEARRRMRMLGLTHAELARRAQVAKGTVARALAGGSILASTLRAIARALAEAEPIPGLEGLIDLGDGAPASAEVGS